MHCVTLSKSQEQRLLNIRCKNAAADDRLTWLLLSSFFCVLLCDQHFKCFYCITSFPTLEIAGMFRRCTSARKQQRFIFKTLRKSQKTAISASQERTYSISGIMFDPLNKLIWYTRAPDILTTRVVGHHRTLLLGTTFKQKYKNAFQCVVKANKSFNLVLTVKHHCKF